MPELHQDPATNQIGDLLRSLHGRDTLWPTDRLAQSGWQMFPEIIRTQLSSWDSPVQTLNGVAWLLDSQPTGSSISRESTAEAAEAVHVPLLPKDQISLITRFIGLGKSQVATLFGVSRQTLYDWLKGKIAPTGDNAQRVALLARAMAPACHDLKRPLFHGFITNPPNRSEASIVELLEQAAWDEHDLTAAFQTARKLTDQRDRDLHLGDWTVSRAVGEDNLLDNSIALDLE